MTDERLRASLDRAWAKIDARKRAERGRRYTLCASFVWVGVALWVLLRVLAFVK